MRLTPIIETDDVCLEDQVRRAVVKRAREAQAREIANATAFWKMRALLQRTIYPLGRQ